MIIRLISESLIVEKQSRPNTMNEVPFMFAYMKKARQELERIASGWIEVRERLQASGTYRELKERM